MGEYVSRQLISFECWHALLSQRSIFYFFASNNWHNVLRFVASSPIRSYESTQVHTAHSTSTRYTWKYRKDYVLTISGRRRRKKKKNIFVAMRHNRFRCFEYVFAHACSLLAQTIAAKAAISSALWANETMLSVCVYGCRCAKLWRMVCAHICASRFFTIDLTWHLTFACEIDGPTRSVAYTTISRQKVRRWWPGDKCSLQLKY